MTAEFRGLLQKQCCASPRLLDSKPIAASPPVQARYQMFNPDAARPARRIYVGGLPQDTKDVSLPKLGLSSVHVGIEYYSGQFRRNYSIFYKP